MLLCDPNFGFTGGNHNPHKLLIVGFLYCTIEDTSDHMHYMWYLANPEMKSRALVKNIKTLIEDLLYVSVDIVLNIVTNSNTEGWLGVKV